MEAPSVCSIERVIDPVDPGYRKWIDVRLSNGMTVRHAVDSEGQYTKEVFSADRELVWERTIAHVDSLSGHLEDTVQIWVRDIEGTSRSTEDAHSAGPIDTVL
jgi:hypothetical protein